MCISNLPAWLLITRWLSVPLIVIILNILISKKTNWDKSKKTTLAVITYIFAGLWFLFFFMMFFAKC